MNWSKLGKQRQQQIVLGAIIGVAAIVAVKQFVIGPMLAGHAQKKAELAELQERLVKADSAIKRDAEILRQLQDSDRQMRQASTDLLPSPENPLAWATRTIYAQARAVGLDIESVADLEMDGGLFTAKEQAKRVFKPYGVRVATQCSYEEAAQFVELLESSNPYVTVAGVVVSAQLNMPQRHQVTFTIEWPSWKDDKQSQAYREEKPHDAA